MIYEKTPGGRQALLTRKPELTRPQRILLLLIDGTRNDVELLRLLVSSQLDAQAFIQLQQLGLIAATSSTNTPQPSQQTPRSPPATGTPETGIEKPVRKLSPLARIGQGLLAVLQPREEPPREISAGLAEVVKCAAVADAGLFAWLEGHVEELRSNLPQAVAHVVQCVTQLRVEIETQDRQLRRSPSPLDFGISLGGVIESILGYGHYLHGEAIGLGMLLSTEIGQTLGVQTEPSAQRLKELLQRCGLPVQLPQLAVARWLELLPVDKTGPAGQIRLMLIEDVAKPVALLVPRDVVVEALDRAGAVVV